MLRFLAEQQHPLAGLAYKMLVFALIENYQDLRAREQLMQRFSVVLDVFPSMPLGTLLTPLLKQISVTEQNNVEPPSFNLYETQLFLVLARHSRLDPGSAQELLEMLLRYYVSNVVMSQVLKMAIDSLLGRFIEHPEFA